MRPPCARRAAEPSATLRGVASVVQLSPPLYPTRNPVGAQRVQPGLARAHVGLEHFIVALAG